MRARRSLKFDSVFMRRRTVLLVSYHYLPAATPGSRRLDTLARLLARRGWEVIVLTATGARAGENGSPDVHVIRTTRRAPADTAEGRPAIARPLVSRIPVVKDVTSFPDRYAPWGITLVPRLMRILASRRVDVVLSSSPPHSMHMAIAAVRALRPFAWVAEFRDPWMFPSRRSPNPISAAVQRRMERRVLARADRVITNTPGNRDVLLAANPGLDRARVRVSTNGYDAAYFLPESFPPVPSERADLTYVGEIYPGMLERYCAALASIRARNVQNVPRLVVYGTIAGEERQRIHAMGLGEFVADRGFVSHQASVDAMKNARALLALLPSQQRWRTCVPSKVYWYLAARRPIVAIVPEGDTAALVREMQAGHALVETDPDILGRRLEELVSEARARNVATLPAPDTERFTMDAIVDDIDALLREVTHADSA
jgi:glycosyltransferase involved in cell wall biosynthesis